MSYLNSAEIDEQEGAAKNDSALGMIEKAERERRELTSFIFNKKMILFEKNEKGVGMDNIGFVKYKRVDGCIDLKDFRQIGIKEIDKVRKKSVQVYPQDDGTFYLLYTNANGLTQVTFNKIKLRK